MLNESKQKQSSNFAHENDIDAKGAVNNFVKLLLSSKILGRYTGFEIFFLIFRRCEVKSSVGVQTWSGRGDGIRLQLRKILQCDNEVNHFVHNDKLSVK